MALLLEEYCSDLLAAGPHFREHDVDALLVYRPQARLRHPETYPAVLAFDPEAPILQVRHEAPPRLVVRVGYVVAQHGLLAGDLADAGHGNAPKMQRARILHDFLPEIQEESVSRRPCRAAPASASLVGQPRPRGS